ncbi:MAG: hypothetical protein U0R19_30500 [Bryobacteraceae bacterium]
MSVTVWLIPLNPPKTAANCPLFAGTGDVHRGIAAEQDVDEIPTPAPVAVHPVKSPVSNPPFTRRFAFARCGMPAERIIAGKSNHGQRSARGENGNACFKEDRLFLRLLRLPEPTKYISSFGGVCEWIKT